MDWLFPVPMTNLRYVTYWVGLCGAYFVLAWLLRSRTRATPPLKIRRHEADTWGDAA
jgi:hypothetical protein